MREKFSILDEIKSKLAVGAIKIQNQNTLFHFRNRHIAETAQMVSVLLHCAFSTQTPSARLNLGYLHEHPGPQGQSRRLSHSSGNCGKLQLTKQLICHPQSVQTSFSVGQ